MMRHHVTMAKIILAFAASSSWACMAQAQAQAQALPEGSPPTPPQASATGPDAKSIQDIVVTAEHRFENVQKVPVAITVLNGDALRNVGVTSFRDAMFIAPSIHTYENTTGLTVAIRGIVTTNPNPQGDPAISYNIDDVYYARSQALTAAFFDINRVEVLNGPQGTTYGRNALAGAVNIVTNDPIHDNQAEASIEIGNYNLISSTAVLNGSLGDQVAIRAAFNSIDHDGYLGGRWDDEDSRAGRLKLLVTPTDKLSILVSGNYSHEGGNGSADVKYPFVDPDHPWTNTLYAANAGRMDRTNWGASAHVSWDLGWATLNYIPAYTKLIDHLEGLQVGGIATNYLSSGAFSNELRLVSNNGDHVGQGQLQWLAGAFLYKESQRYALNIVSPIFPFTRFPVILNDAQNYPSITTRSFAFYGQATYGVRDWLRVIGGLRYTQDRKTQSGSETTIAGFPPFFGVPFTVVATGGPRTDNVSYRAMVEADLTPRAMLYGGVTTGYHAGGEFIGTANNLYGPEKITDYEVGLKSRWLDNLLQVNIDGYYYDYTGVHTAVIVPPLAVGVFNAKSARVYGSELDIQFRLTGNDRFDIGISYEDAKYLSFVIPNTVGAIGGTPVAGGVNFSGETLPYVSKWSGTLGYQHVFQLGGGATLSGGVSSYFRTRYWTTIDQTNGLHLAPAYTNTSVNLAFTSANRRWSVSAYLRNIEGDPDVSYIISNALGTYANPAPPRTVGARFGVKF